MNISIVIPTFKEKANIKKLVNLIKSEIQVLKIVIVDDSPDEEIRDEINDLKDINYIYRGKKLGRGSAVIEGLNFAQKNFDSEIFIEMDADLSHDPKELKENLRLFKENNCDLLIASRYLKKSKIVNWSILRKIFSFLANSLARFLLKIPISDYTNGYRIYSKNAVRHIRKNCGNIGDGFIILSEILVELYYNNFQIRETSSKFINRSRGESSVNLNEIVNSFIGLIKIYKLKNKIKQKSN
tara:strand:- start:3250 stop:3972 length:723 start_codon:yes stop_codon:yes gene_type:complete